MPPSSICRLIRRQTARSAVQVSAGVEHDKSGGRQQSDLKAAVPYYGSVPAVEDVPKIKASMLCHYAGEDKRINEGIPAFEEAMKKAGIDYQIYIYEGAQHGFNNDSSPGRYNKEAAELAWKRTTDFFKQKLS